jgi:hypothetical protein
MQTALPQGESVPHIHMTFIKKATVTALPVWSLANELWTLSAHNPLIAEAAIELHRA